MNKFFMIPSPVLGLVEDVFPERVHSGYNDWIHLSKEILKRKKQAVANGQWVSPVEIGDDSQFLHPVGAEYCPALNEIMSLGYLIKWPAHLILRRVKDKAWQIKASVPNNPFYSYHFMTSFAEAGEAEALTINTGWMFVTPPGWSLMVKNIPNNLTGRNHGIQLAEGIVRTDQATVGLQVHAYIPSHAPDEIKIRRGDALGLVFPFRREALEPVVASDGPSVEEAKKYYEKSEQTFNSGAGCYRNIYIDNENPTPFYDWLISKHKE